MQGFACPIQQQATMNVHRTEFKSVKMFTFLCRKINGEKSEDWVAAEAVLSPVFHVTIPEEWTNSILCLLS
jgi:hypothetical protein